MTESSPARALNGCPPGEPLNGGPARAVSGRGRRGWRREPRAPAPGGWPRSRTSTGHSGRCAGGRARCRSASGCGRAPAAPRGRRPLPGWPSSRAPLRCRPPPNRSAAATGPAGSGPPSPAAARSEVATTRCVGRRPGLPHPCAASARGPRGASALRGAAAVVYDPSLCLPLPEGTDRIMAIWLIPTLASLFLYGIGQGLVKKYISEVPPARFRLYFVAAQGIPDLSYFALFQKTELISTLGSAFSRTSLLAYLVDGVGWILYFLAIVHGPIAIVGTLSAAYPALTILFARLFLHEQLTPVQYAGLALVIGGCLGLSYAPAGPGSRPTSRRWIPLSFVALLLWGCS